MSALPVNVIPLRAPGYLLDDARACLTETMRGRTFSRAKLLVVWKDHIKAAGGEQALLDALRAYVKQDKDVARTGGPGLQVWLRAGRYEHWIGKEAAETITHASERDRFPDPDLWDAVAALLGAGWAVSYLSQCGCEDGWLTIPRAKSTAIERLKENASRLKACGVVGVRLVDAPT